MASPAPAPTSPRAQSPGPVRSAQPKAAQAPFPSQLARPHRRLAADKAGPLVGAVQSPRASPLPLSDRATPLVSRLHPSPESARSPDRRVSLTAMAHLAAPSSSPWRPLLCSAPQRRFPLSRGPAPPQGRGPTGQPPEHPLLL